MVININLPGILAYFISKKGKVSCKNRESIHLPNVNIFQTNIKQFNYDTELNRKSTS